MELKALMMGPKRRSEMMAMTGMMQHWRKVNMTACIAIACGEELVSVVARFFENRASITPMMKTMTKQSRSQIDSEMMR